MPTLYHYLLVHVDIGTLYHRTVLEHHDLGLFGWLGILVHMEVSVHGILVHMEVSVHGLIEDCDLYMTGAILKSQKGAVLEGVLSRISWLSQMQNCH